jgi:hypothetical protein
VASVTIGVAPPATPKVGDLWWDSTGGQLYLWYDDGTSKQWVVANNPMLAGYLALAGGTMQGTLTLAADPIAPLQAVTKRYADKMLPLAGGTMTGNLTIAPTSTSPLLYLNKSASGQETDIVGMNNGKNRWAITLGDASAETGAATGSDLGINRYDDFGAMIDRPLVINRATSAVELCGTYPSIFDNKGNLALGGAPPPNQFTAVSANGGGWMFSWGITINNWANNAYYDGTNWRYWQAGAMWNQQMTGNEWFVQYAPSGNAGDIASPATVFEVDTAGNTIIHGNLTVDGNVNTNNITYGWLISNNYYGHSFGFGWDGTSCRVAVDGGDQGYFIRSAPWGGWYQPYMEMWNPNGWYYSWSTSGAVRWTYTWDSDRRLKKNIVPATIDALGAINQLKVYELDYTPPLKDAHTHHMECAIIADEVEPLIPSAYSGPVDMPDGTPSYAAINILPLTCTLIRAMQQLTDKVTSLTTRNDELLERIIALEARLGRA